MQNPLSADTAQATESWAEVRARDHVMRYRRSGAGRAVLLLSSPGDPEPVWPELTDALCANFRLIVPEPPGADADVAGWLATFLEGLGLSDVGIVATDRYCLAALELALATGEVERMVLVAGGGREAGGGRLETTVRRMGIPLLMIGRGQDADEVVPLVTGFLGDRGGVPAA